MLAFNFFFVKNKKMCFCSQYFFLHIISSIKYYVSICIIGRISVESRVKSGNMASCVVARLFGAHYIRKREQTTYFFLILCKKNWTFFYFLAWFFVMHNEKERRHKKTTSAERQQLYGLCSSINNMSAS